MTRKQEETPHQGRTPIQVYVDPEQWARFAIVSEAQHRTRSGQIRELIRRDIEQYEAAA